MSWPTTPEHQPHQMMMSHTMLPLEDISPGGLTRTKGDHVGFLSSAWVELRHTVAFDSCGCLQRPDYGTVKGAIIPSIMPLLKSTCVHE